MQVSVKSYLVFPIPARDGVGYALYLASCEPYHPYLEEHDHDWIYLFQAPLDGEAYDETVEKIIFEASAHDSATHMDILYSTETFRAKPEYRGATIFEQETLLWREDTYIQKGLNALAPKTSKDDPLYMVWCGGNLYGVVGERAYLLFLGKDGRKDITSVPEFEKTQHTPCVRALGPITEDDYYEAPASPS